LIRFLLTLGERQTGQVLVYGFAKKSQSERRLVMEKSSAKYFALLS
jgi:hypothetical protein